MASAVHIPWTPAQRQRICCYLRENGLWDDRHQVCGVASLSDLTIDQARALIERFNGGPQSSALPRRKPRRLLPRLAEGAIRPATDLQRQRIVATLEELGWPETTRQHWLKARHLIDDPLTTPMSTATASKVITELDRALRKTKGNRQSAKTAEVAEVPF